MKLRPPWTVEAVVAAACTGCGACARTCPQGIVAMGAGNLPEIRLEETECTFCGLCAEACPEPVFDRVRPAFVHAISIGEDCLPRAGIECRSCQDACPEAAIRFSMRIGAPALPALDAGLCTGCGACIAPCPVGAIRAAMPAREAVGA